MSAHFKARMDGAAGTTLILASINDSQRTAAKVLIQ
jgi:hypothetical protein